jgi:hypothetical protein
MHPEPLKEDTRAPAKGSKYTCTGKRFEVHVHRQKVRSTHAPAKGLKFAKRKATLCRCSPRFEETQSDSLGLILSKRYKLALIADS